MTTIVIDESSKEGKAFVELLRQMKFAQVLEGESDWWVTISPAEREAIKKTHGDGVNVSFKVTKKPRPHASIKVNTPFEYSSSQQKDCLSHEEIRPPSAG